MSASQQPRQSSKTWKTGFKLRRWNTNRGNTISLHYKDLLGVTHDETPSKPTSEAQTLSGYPMDDWTKTEYLQDALAGLADGIVDDFDRQYHNIQENIPVHLRESREHQWNFSCGIQRGIWDRARKQMRSFNATEHPNPAAAAKAIIRVWDNAVSSAADSPKTNDQSKLVERGKRNRAKP